MASLHSKPPQIRYSRVVAAALLLALALQGVNQYKREEREQKRVMGSALKRLVATQELGRAVYPYSVIPGGVQHAEDLAVAVKRDPVVRNHYADFELDRVRLVTASSDRYAYVSYRRHNRVLWTQQKLRIPKGEVLMTDGTSRARARCGNRLSDEAQLSEEAENAEPGDFVFNTPVAYRLIPLEAEGEDAPEPMTLPLAADRLAELGQSLPDLNALPASNQAAPLAMTGSGESNLISSSNPGSEGSVGPVALQGSGGAGGGGSGISGSLGSNSDGNGSNSGAGSGGVSPKDDPSGVPEPGAALLVGVGMLLTAGLIRKFRFSAVTLPSTRK